MQVRTAGHFVVLRVTLCMAAPQMSRASSMLTGNKQLIPAAMGLSCPGIDAQDAAVSVPWRRDLTMLADKAKLDVSRVPRVVSLTILVNLSCYGASEQGLRRLLRRRRASTRNNVARQARHQLSTGYCGVPKVGHRGETHEWPAGACVVAKRRGRPDVLNCWFVYILL